MEEECLRRLARNLRLVEAYATSYAHAKLMSNIFMSWVVPLLVASTLSNAFFAWLRPEVYRVLVPAIWLIAMLVAIALSINAFKMYMLLSGEKVSKRTSALSALVWLLSYVVSTLVLGGKHWPSSIVLFAGIGNVLTAVMYLKSSKHRLLKTLQLAAGLVLILLTPVVMCAGSYELDVGGLLILSVYSIVAMISSYIADRAALKAIRQWSNLEK